MKRWLNDIFKLKKSSTVKIPGAYFIFKTSANQRFGAHARVYMRHAAEHGTFLANFTPKGSKTGYTFQP